MQNFSIGRLNPVRVQPGNVAVTCRQIVLDLLLPFLICLTIVRPGRITQLCLPFRHSPSLLPVWAVLLLWPRRFWCQYSLDRLACPVCWSGIACLPTLPCFACSYGSPTFPPGGSVCFLMLLLLSSFCRLTLLWQVVWHILLCWLALPIHPRLPRQRIEIVCRMWLALVTLHLCLPSPRLWLALVGVRPCWVMVCLPGVGLHLGVFGLPLRLVVVLLGNHQDTLPLAGVLLLWPRATPLCQLLGCILAHLLGWICLLDVLIRIVVVVSRHIVLHRRLRGVGRSPDAQDQAEVHLMFQGGHILHRLCLTGLGLSLQIRLRLDLVLDLRLAVTSCRRIGRRSICLLASSG